MCYIKLTVAPGGPIGIGNACRISSIVAPCKQIYVKICINLNCQAGLGVPPSDYIYLWSDKHLPTRQTWKSWFPLTTIFTLWRHKHLSVATSVFSLYLYIFSFQKHLHLHLHLPCPPGMREQLMCVLKK